MTSTPARASRTTKSPWRQLHVVVVVRDRGSETGQRNPLDRRIHVVQLAVVEVPRGVARARHEASMRSRAHAHSDLIERVVARQDHDIVEDRERLADALLRALISQGQFVRGLVLELDAQLRHLGLQSTVEILDVLHIGARVQRTQGAPRRTMRIAYLAGIVANVAAVDEPQCRIEIRLHLLDSDTAFEAGRVRRPHPYTPSAVFTVEPFGRALLSPRFGFERAAIRQTGVLVAEVDARDRVVDIRERIAVRDDEADGRLGQHVGRDASYEQVRGLHALELVLPDCERTHRPTADAAAELAAAFETRRLSRGAQADATREKRQRILLEWARERRVHRALPDAPELVDVRILQKEVSLLGKEQSEPRQIDLAIVDLGRREIGIQRHRSVQRRRDLVEHVERRLRSRNRRRVARTRAARAAVNDGTISKPKPCRRPMSPVISPEIAGLCVRFRETQPIVSLLRATRRLRLRPQVSRFRIERNRLERNPRLRHPTVGALCARLPARCRSIATAPDPRP